MEELDELDDDAWGTVFRDVILLTLIGFVAMIVILLPHVVPAKKQTEDQKAPGNVIVEMHWPSDMPVDVDLWVQAPNEFPVGFWNMGGPTFNLLRDDLGGQADVTEINYEVSYSRGVPEGEYTVNVHLYRDMSGQLPLPVTVSVSVKSAPSMAAKRILTTKLKLDHQGQELTAFRFALDADGRLVAGSVHDLPKPLRAAKTSG